jgi:2-amino-4-hydroxy-6-hydroxymethyldihydropteridine diphosphokinase
MTLVIISIGSNIDPELNIFKAKDLLLKAFNSCKFSSIYKSPAEGFEGPEFHNLALSIVTELNPGQLNILLKVLEKKLGRDETQRKFVNRVIDLDLIMYDDLIYSENGLELPSSDILEYLFVLKSVHEIAGDLRHPISKKTFTQILEEF